MENSTRLVDKATVSATEQAMKSSIWPAMMAAIKSNVWSPRLAVQVSLTRFHSRNPKKIAWVLDAKCRKKPWLTLPIKI